jgi:P27 family predicted phage terminase small subunit
MGGKGSGGHNRKPTAQKLAEGNRGKRPLNLCEPKALPGEPQMPSGMTEQARAVWPEVVAMLKANEVLFQTDGLAIAALCSNLVLFWQADRAVQELGSVREWRMNPSVRVRSDAEKKLRACWQLFGLDPSSRPGVQIDGTGRDPQSALDSVLRAKSAKDEIID